MQNWANDPKAAIRPGERLDDLQLAGLKLIQNPAQFCFGIDAVLLSDFVRIRKTETMLDMGTGNGILPILLSAKTSCRHFTGLEIQEDAAALARRNVVLNGLKEKIDIVTGDIREASARFKTGTFDVITANPPYMKDAHGLKNADESRTIARHEVLCTLDDVLRESRRLLEDKGRIYLVHRPYRLAEILEKMRAYRLEPKRIQFVHPKPDREPVLVLAEGVRGANQNLKVEPPLILCEEQKPGDRRPED